MRYFIWSHEGMMAPLAYKLQKENCEVYYRQDSNQSNLNGLIQINKSGRPKKSDTILFDSNIFNSMAEEARSYGHNVIGCCPELIKPKDVKTITYHHFNNTEKAREFILENIEKQFVFLSEEFNYNPKDNNLLLISWLKTLPSEMEFDLKELIKGIELNIYGWFDGLYWIDGSYCCSIEEEKPYNGLMWTHQFMPKIFSIILGDITEELEAVEYVGPVGAKVVVTPEYVYLDKFITEFDYSFYALHSKLWYGTFDETFKALVNDEIEVMPTQIDKMSAGMKIYSTKEAPIIFPYDDSIWYNSVVFEKGQLKGMKDKDLGMICEAGSDFYNVKQTILDKSNQLVIPESYHCNDIIPNAMNKIQELSMWGYDPPGFMGYPLLETNHISGLEKEY